MSVFKEASPEPIVQAVENIPSKEPTGERESVSTEYVDPKQSDEVVLRALGYDESILDIPSVDQENLHEVREFVNQVVKDKGLKPEASSYKKVLEDLRNDMDLDLNTDPSVVLDKVAGVIKSWKSLAFVKDARDKRVILMKLAKAPDSKTMNKIVFDAMERSQVWR
jgi:hypothetical protein